MIRTVKSLAAVLAAATAIAVVPGAAVAADQHGDGPLVVFGDHNQFADGDIFNAGQDNIVGSFEGAATMPGAGLPGVQVAVVRLEVDATVGFSGLVRVSQDGSGDYPRQIPPNYRVNVPIDGPSTVEYRSQPDQGRVTVTSTIRPDGSADPRCAVSGNLGCQIDRDAQGMFVKISGRF